MHPGTVPPHLPAILVKGPQSPDEHQDGAVRLPSSGTPFSFVREPLPRPPRAWYPATLQTPPQMAVSALQRSSSDPHAIVPYSRIQPPQFNRAQSAGERAIAAMKEDDVHTTSIYAAEGAESLDYPAPSSPLKAHNEQKVQRRRPKTSSREPSTTRACSASPCRSPVSPGASVASVSSTTLRQYSPETLAAAQNLLRDRLRSYRSLLQAEADSARHGQRHQLQQAKADDDAHCAKERIQQWLRDSGQLHQQAAPTALQGKTSGV